MRGSTRMGVLGFFALAVLAGAFWCLTGAVSVNAQTVEPPGDPVESDVEGLCTDARVTDLHGWVQTSDDDGSSVVYLDWSYDVEPWPEEMDEILFRVERRMADSSEWEMLDAADFEGGRSSGADPGVWIYRVSIASIAVGEEVEQCAFDADSADETEELKVPTVEEWAEPYLLDFCNIMVEVSGLIAVMPETAGPGNFIMLKWDDNMEYLRRYQDEWPFLPDTVHFRVERAPAADADDEAAWIRLGETERTIWTTPADYGHWYYRVATVRVEGVGVVQECQPWWNSVEVRLLTPEEQAEHDRQITALEGEAVRCATEVLVVNFQGDAKEIVAGYVQGRVDKLVAEYDDYTDPDDAVAEMVALAVLMCADRDEPSPFGVDLGGVWATLEMLEDGPYSLW